MVITRCSKCGMIFPKGMTLEDRNGITTVRLCTRCTTKALE